MRVAILAGGKADRLAEHARQVAGVAEAAGLRDAGQVALAGRQQPARMRQAPCAYPGVRRLAERGVEHAGEMVGGQGRHARQLVQRQGFVQVRVHVVHDAPAHGGRQAPARGLRRLARHALLQQMVQHGFGGAAGGQAVGGLRPISAQQLPAYVDQRGVLDVGAVAQFQRAGLAVQAHDGFAGQPFGGDVQVQEMHGVVHAPARIVFGRQHAEFSGAAV
ncbi:hypothetical protein D3C73_1181150 [compost metagenome]